MVVDVVLPAVLGLVLVREAGVETCANRTVSGLLCHEGLYVASSMS